MMPQAAGEQASTRIQVVAVIKPELSLTVEPETGDRLDLGTIYSSSTEERASQPVKVKVGVFSNLGHPYQVTQELVEPLTNEDGSQLPPGYLIVNQPDALGGDSGFVDAQQTQVVLASDARGRSEKRSVAYQLRVPPSQDAGTYRGTIVFTVTAL